MRARLTATVICTCVVLAFTGAGGRAAVAVEPAPPAPARIAGSLEVSALLIHVTIGSRIALYVSERRSAAGQPIYAVEVEVDASVSSLQPSAERRSLTAADARAAADAIAWAAEIRPAMTRLGQDVIVMWRYGPFAVSRHTRTDAALLSVAGQRAALARSDIDALVAGLRSAADHVERLTAGGD